jgi:DUF1009 family protein
MTSSEAHATLLPGDRVGLIAGAGALPADVARALAQRGFPPFVIIVEGEGAPAEPLKAFPHRVMPLEEFASFLPVMRAEGVTHAVMAGAVTRRPRLASVPWGLRHLRLLPRAVRALRKGDDGLLREIVRYAEEHGVRIVGPQELVPDLLTSEGCLTKAKPTAADTRDVEAALEAARALGRLDAGQGTVAIGGRVIALEGVEGTDAMLARVAELRSHPRLAGKTRGVLVMCAKPNQVLRLDLPAIGPATVAAAHAAGLAGIGVEVGRTFVLEQAETVALADRLGLFVVGLPGDEP